MIITNRLVILTILYIILYIKGIFLCWSYIYFIWKQPSVINHSSTRFQTQDPAISLQTTLNLSTLFLWWRDVLLSKAAGRLMSTNFSGTNFPRCEASGSSVECQMASPQQRDPHLVSDRRNKLPVTSHSLNFNWIHVYIGTSSILWTMK